MDGQDADAATHELGHRFQYSVNSINDLEHAFLIRRTSVPSADFPGHIECQELEPVYGNSMKELCRPDHFANRYMGKEYEKVTEMVTMGMASLFMGANGGVIGVGRSDQDREFRNFILRCSRDSQTLTRNGSAEERFQTPSALGIKLFLNLPADLCGNAPIGSTAKGQQVRPSARALSHLSCDPRGPTSIRSEHAMEPSSREFADPCSARRVPEL